MTKPTILITGATGKTGAAVVAELRSRDWPVRALVHVRDGRSAHLERLGAEVVVADLYDPEQILEAMRGTTRAYYCPPFQPYMIQSAVAFALAAAEAKLEAIVGLSQWLASASHPSLLSRQSWLCDGLFRLVPNAAHTIINPGYFADNYLRLINFAAHLGLFPMTVDGESRNAPPSNEDIARVAAAVLLDPERHDGKIYRPTGPALLSVREMAVVLSRVLDRKVHHVNIPMWMFVKAARMQGVSAYELSGWRYYSHEHDSGAFEHGAPTNDVFEVTGRQPEEFETVARRYAALPIAKRTLGNSLRELARFMLVPFSPGYNLDRFEHDQCHPVPPNPRFAIENASWRAKHNPHTASRSIVHKLDLGVPAQPPTVAGQPGSV